MYSNVMSWVHLIEDKGVNHYSVAQSWVITLVHNCRQKLI